MYSNQFLDTKLNNSNFVRKFGIQSANMNQKYIVNWSPQGSKFLSKRQFLSPRGITKSLPHRSRGFPKHRMNRSLSFDISCIRNNTYRSPNSSSDSSYDDDRQLSRSAKIMKALNINCDKLNKRSSIIKKSLKFDFSPSPKRSVCNTPIRVSLINLNTPSPKLHRTLKFDTSSGESSIGSIILTPSGSMDENQNQTPVQRNRSVKKTLKYDSPEAIHDAESKDSFIKSPLLMRNALREKINNIVQTNPITTNTPNVHSMQRINFVKQVANNITVSTPRNLIHDFEDDNMNRPLTPENTICLIPESMSAIKKSHKKERLARRNELGVGLIRMRDSELDKKNSNESCKIEKRAETPTTEMQISPSYDIKSIKKSHKKDKSKKKSFICNSDEESSDAGSLFEYSEKLDENSKSPNEREEMITSKNNLSEEICSPKFRNLGFGRSSTNNFNRSQVNESEEISDVNCQTLQSEENPVALSNVTPKNRIKILIENTDELSENDTQRPTTPENHMNFLDRIMLTSIKKSHKKLKDENKIKLFKPKALHKSTFVDILNTENKSENQQIDDDSDDDMPKTENSIAIESNRASTPENVNSSRMLLSQFSSVKKSHRKDKHNKILTASINRQKIFNRSYDPIEHFSLERHPHASLSKSDPTNMVHSNYLDKKSNEINITGSIFDKLSPSKRKFRDAMSTNKLTEYEKAEEEFRIFTPIKKRKQLVFQSARKPTVPVVKEQDSLNEDSILDVDMSRCITPVMRQEEFLNSDEESPKLIEITKINNSIISSDNHDNSQSDVNGRETPQNTLTADLICDIKSIKKSHKKDKRGFPLRNRLNCENINVNYNFKVPIINLDSSSNENSFEDINSTEIENKEESDSNNHNTSLTRENVLSSLTQKNEPNNGSNKTPPNCLRVINHMKLLQTTSIKKSHKKIREIKKVNLAKDDQELSDDGSLFGDEDRIDLPVKAQNEQPSDDCGQKCNSKTIVIRSVKRSSRIPIRIGSQRKMPLLKQNFSNRYQNLDGSISFNGDENMDNSPLPSDKNE